LYYIITSTLIATATVSGVGGLMVG